MTSQNPSGEAGAEQLPSSLRPFHAPFNFSHTDNLPYIYPTIPFLYACIQKPRCASSYRAPHPPPLISKLSSTSFLQLNPVPMVNSRQFTSINIAFFIFLIIINCQIPSSSARLILGSWRSPRLAASEPELNLFLSKDVKNDGQQHLSEVSTTRVIDCNMVEAESFRNVEKQIQMKHRDSTLFSILPRGTPVPPSAPSKKGHGMET